MELPKNADKVAEAFEGLSPERKRDLIAHLAAVPQNRAKAVIDQIVANGGKDGEFVAKMFNVQTAKKK